MFDGSGTPRKPEEREEARRLRKELGLPIKRIAAYLDVSPSSVLYWTRDIKLTPEQRERNYRGPTGPQNPEQIAARMKAWSERARDKRRGYQRDGRERARLGEPTHRAGCMLYWAEGAKDRNSVCFANSDLNMVRVFVEFLRECFGIGPDQLTMRLNVYTGNGLSIEEIEDHWLESLGLPRTCLRRHTLNHHPTSSSGRRPHRLPYGVCQLRVVKSTELVQHIYGAIQEYGGFDEPRWLDGPQRKRKAA
jgi:hypothetical protein